jgi:hypothetical protein
MTVEELAAENWYGYGRWNAPYWFIGPEPGKAKKEGENLLARCRAWLDLCPNGPQSGGLIDSRDHHARFNRLEFFVPEHGKKRVPTQNTWRQLIRLLLAYENKPYDNECIAKYQAEKWGRRDGETCVAELSALAMNKLSQTQKLRDKFRMARTMYLSKKIAETRPDFVVMYGGGKRTRKWWQMIACGNANGDCFESRELLGWTAYLTIRSSTVFVVSKHPVNPGGASPPDDYWIAIANEIKLRRKDR